MFASNIFLDFDLPNATTWFYFSFLLAIALFFKFARLLSVRNLDVITLFFMVPGLLMVQYGRAQGPIAAQPQAVMAANAVGHLAAGEMGGAGTAWGGLAVAFHPAATTPQSPNWMWLGYLSILLGSAYFFIRCLADLTLVQRPALAPNLTLGGSVWLAAALFVCLSAVAFREPDLSKSASPANPPPSADASPIAKDRVGPEASSVTLTREALPDWLKRSLAVLCHLLVVIGLVLIGRWHFQDTAAGMAAATFYLILPYTGFYVGQIHHVGPIALVVWAVVAYRLPTVSGILFGVAMATAYFPALVFPLWVSFYWRRGAGRFLLAALVTAALCLTASGIVLWWHGQLEESLHNAFQLEAWQPWLVPPDDTEGFWMGVHWAYRIPLFIAFLSFVLLTPFWPLPKNLAQVMALSAAVFIGIQFWYANRGGEYVLWYLPLLLLLVFRPNLEDRRPPTIDAETDWAARALRSIGAMFRWLTQPKPEPVKMGR